MKYLLSLAILFSSLFVSAQSAQEEIDFMQSIFGMEKKAFVAEMVTLTDENRDAFWVAYDEYEAARKELGKKRISLLERYAENYETMSEADMNKLIMESMALGDKTNSLIKTHYKKIQKDAGGLAAAQFYQIETYIAGEIRVAIMGSIPMVEKLKQ